ncbi:transposase [Bradyrhizobium sp. i1.8.4]
MSAECSSLSAERDAAIAQRDAAIQENDKLLMILSQYKRTIFGPRSETLDLGQLSLFTITAQAARAAANDDVTGGRLPDGAEGRGKRPARRNRGKLPEHLPRIDVVIDIESHICPCCSEQLHKIGEIVKEAFDVIPMQYRVKRIVRPRYGCRGCRQGVLQAPAPAQAIDGGMVTEALLAHIAVMKYGYQLPLYRQEQMFAAQGITLDRQTLASWMGRLAWWLKPLHALLRRAVMSYPRLFADETPLPVLDPGRGRTKVCQFWAIATDDRPWGGPGAAGSGLRVRRGSQGDPRQAAVWRLRRHPAGRWLCCLQGPDQERRPSDATCVLLRACAAEVLGRSRRDEVADCRGSAAADRDVLRHRGSHSRFAGDAASYGAAIRH